MKATELMIGDWVESSFFGKTRITSSREYEGYGWVMTSNSEDWKSDMSLSPIPLAAEILEKNGWVFIFPESEYRSPEDIAFKESLRLQNGADGNAFWWIVGYALICPINYVHELQHALRLCGLNELADNFKV